MSAVVATETLPLLQQGGWYVLEIRGARDIPGYDPDEVARGMGEQMRRREVDGDWTATAGKLVYPEFHPALHKATEPIPFDPYKPLVLCWDQGGTPAGGTPCAVPTQVNALGQWCIWEASIPAEDESVGIYEFATEWVAARLREEYALPYGLTVDRLRMLHFGDPAGNVKPSKTVTLTNPKDELRACYDIIRRGLLIPTGYDEQGEPTYIERPGLGWVIQSGEMQLAKRMEALRSRLTARVRGTGGPALLVDPSASSVIDAFAGGYHYKQRSDGRYELDPFKNWYANIANALEYGASKLFATQKPRDDEDALPTRGAGRGAGRVRSRRDG